MLNAAGTLNESIAKKSNIEQKNSEIVIAIKDGIHEKITFDYLTDKLTALSQDISDINVNLVASKAFIGSYAKISKSQWQDLLVRTAASMIVDEPNYSYLAARLLSEAIYDELKEQNIESFHQSLIHSYNSGLINEKTKRFADQHEKQLNKAINHNLDNKFAFFGLRTLQDRYLLKHPSKRTLLESPQYMLMRIACGLAASIEDALDMYELFSSFDYMPSSPTLFNSGTKNPQLSSCFLVDSPQDNLESIYERYKDIACLSKHGGGIGISYSRVRSNGSLIKGTNGMSNGIIPWLKTLDSSVAAVNQGGRRKGACCVYLENWHADIESFLELRDNTGDESRRAHNLNLANWISDIFMNRVKNNEKWSLFDPAVVPHLVDLYGKAFEKAYTQAEEEKLYEKQIDARVLYGRMIKTLAQTGNGWMAFKDSSNIKCNQTAEPGAVVHLSNLCTEIIEVTSSEQTAVCNLGSINLSNHIANNNFDFEKLAKTTKQAIKQLNRVIDINYYPIAQAIASNLKWRPVGLGLMGLQDVFFKLGINFDSKDAVKISQKISETIYFYALEASCELAEKYGPHPSYLETKTSQGLLQFDLWQQKSDRSLAWEPLREKIKEFGLRNSLLIAIAPTATIASIVGCYECIEPQVSNLFKRETLSGEFLQINSYLVKELKKRNLWNNQIRDMIIEAEGCLENIDSIPQILKDLFRTAWQLPQKALIDLAASRGPFIDQSQSLNLFMESPSIGKLSSMYFYAWQSGLKTCYYLRSRPATKIAKTTTKKTYSTKESVACSLENPQYCEACQ